jgi:head-tail adaptor
VSGQGTLVERLLIERNDPEALPVTTLTRAAAVATVTTAAPHRYTNGDYVTIAGAVPAGYNGKIKITVTAPTMFTYPCASTLTTPATGTITARYVNDAQGNPQLGWTPIGPALPAELVPIRGIETLQQAAFQAETTYRFRVRVRRDLTTSMRAQWRPRWPGGGGPLVLAIVGLLPDGDGSRYLFVDTKGA